MQEQIINSSEMKKEVQPSSEMENTHSNTTHNKQYYNQENEQDGGSLLSIFSSGDGNTYDATLAEELQAQKLKKKKKKGIRR